MHDHSAASPTSLALLGALKAARQNAAFLRNKSPIPHTYVELLMAIGNFKIEHQIDCTPKQLCAHLNRSLPSITRSLGELEAQQLITRQICSDDRRQVSLSLTEKGQDICNNFHRGMIEITEHFLRELGEQDTEHLLRILSKVQDIFEEITQERGDEHC